MRRDLWGIALLLAVGLGGCDDGTEPAAVDAAADSGGDARPIDMAPDAIPDMASDTLPDMAPNGMPDMAPDAETDALVADMATALDMTPDAMPVDLGPDAAPDAIVDALPPDGPPCLPLQETCDEVDEDCDGIVDERSADEDLGSATGIVARGSTIDAPRRPHPCGVPSPSVDFAWTAPAAGVWRIETRGSGFDTILAVQTDTCDAAPACNDNHAPGDTRSVVELELAEGERRVITIAGSVPGDYVLHITEAGPREPSYVGRAALGILRDRHAADQGVTWNLSTDAVFPVDWVLQIPHARTWGRPAAETEAVPVVPEDAPPDSFHPDFGLPYCVFDDDCDVGTCELVAATVDSNDQMPRALCMGPSDHIWDAMYIALVGAESVADVSSLDFPDNAAGVVEVQEGRFLIAMRNALRFLHSTGDAVQVRFMFGWLVNDFEWEDHLEARVAALTDGIPNDTALRLYFGGMNYDLFSWNHSKIIAADGRRLLQGGINFYSTDYLGPAPVQDISMWVHGTPARDGHRYLDAIWRAFVDDYGGFRGDLDGIATTMVTLPADMDPPGDIPLEPPAPAEAPGVPVISMGRLGLVDRDGVDEPSPSDDAMLAAIGAARESLEFSLQDLGSVRDGTIVEVPFWGELDFSYGWPERLMRTLTRRSLAGVSVQIIISETGAGAYSYGWTKREALDAWRQIIEADADLAAETIAAEGSVVDFLCNRIDFASVRIDGEADRWGDGSGMGNHSKFWIVDGRAFYMGSQNLYLSNLFEWGLLVDDLPTTDQIRREYWHPLWAASSRTAVSGPAAEGRCVLREPPPEPPAD